MTFFEHQEAARRKTWLLVIYFLLAVVLTVGAVYLAVIIISNLTFDSSPDGTKLQFHVGTIWNPQLFAIVSAVTLLIIFGGTIFKIIGLGGGGAAVARELGGVQVAPASGDFFQRRLLNIVEEMAIASGIPVPPVFVINDESINAFAAGYTPNTAVIGVTRGCMDLLNRDELQGVIAHEFSHILNGDMRLNIRLIGFLHGLLLIALTGYWMLRALSNSSVRRSGSKKEGGGLQLGWGLLGLSFVVIGYVGVLFGKLIKAAVSRQREFLADASAVQFTRNPLGISGALQKIGGYNEGSRISSSNAEEASHMFFADGLSRVLFQMFATHPPLAERISRIDPTFKGEFIDVEPERVKAALVEAERNAKTKPTSEPPIAFGTAAIAAAQILQQVGQLTPEHIAHASRLIGALPEDVLDLVRTVNGAKAITYALLLDANEHAREPQITFIANQENTELAKLTLVCADKARTLPASGRLPLLDLAVPGLRGMTREDYDRFRNVVYYLLTADGRYSLFEYTLQRVLIRHLDPHFRKEKAPITRFSAYGQVERHCQVLLSALAQHGHSDSSIANKAYLEGFKVLGTDSPPPILPLDECGLKQLDAALSNLALATPHLKEKIIGAAADCVATDGQVTVEEAELLRATADCLDCPVPPLL